ncbi:hypothetical protein U1Q18_038601 [Sarracenia purpurea var. burkii]
MEFTQQGLLEELLAPTRDAYCWTNFLAGANDFSNGWISESFDDETQEVFSPPPPPPNPPFLGLNSSPTEPNFPSPLFNGLYPFHDDLTVPDKIDSSYDNNGAPPDIPVQEEEEQPPLMARNDGDQYGFVGSDRHTHFQSLEERVNESIRELNMGFNGERKVSRVKKVEGQPSKNLMAERRRRKRLNDRLLMLRSIVPKISKMDRTSILGDTIDYMKELLEKIKILREEDKNVSMNNQDLMARCKEELKPNELLVRNSPMFDVERTNIDTRIEMSCAAKPGLLLSTVNTLEALGLDIQQCVISCFNDFSMQASCSEDMQQRSTTSSEDIKQALCRCAGYGGRCL